MSRVSTASSPTVGGLADRKPAGAGVRVGIFLLPLAMAWLGCRVFSAGLATDGTAAGATGMGPSDSGGEETGPPVDRLGGWTSDSGANRGDARQPADVTPVIGVPATVGCSDGTREGFRDLENWPNIAGCAGGWNVPGLLATSSRSPSCDRVAGNDSPNSTGAGCCAADLCALTWHACLDGPDVASHSPTGGCESIVSPGDKAFFVVMAGASPQGVCYPDSSAVNDLHGCGSASIGQPESEGCPPLTRRMGFADCEATDVWQCGSADDSLDEAEVVTKLDSSMGGVLCCKD
jgi:hypothetical protein